MTLLIIFYILKLQTVHNDKFPAVCVPLNFMLFTKVLSIFLFSPLCKWSSIYDSCTFHTWHKYI